MPRQAAAAAGFATGTNGDPDAVEAARGSRPDGARRIRRPHHWRAARSISCRPIFRCSPPMRRPSSPSGSRAGELAAAYVVDDRPSPWLPIWQAKVRALTTLARMLALSPGGRVASKSAESHEPVSYYSNSLWSSVMNEIDEIDRDALKRALVACRAESRGPRQAARFHARR